MKHEYSGVIVQINPTEEILATSISTISAVRVEKGPEGSMLIGHILPVTSFFCQMALGKTVMFNVTIEHDKMPGTPTAADVKEK